MIRNLLPEKMFIKLFGNRNKYGQSANELDKDWIDWQKNLWTFNDFSKKPGLFDRIHDFGYKVVSDFDFNNKKIFEIGPGKMSYLKYFNGIPSEFHIADSNKEGLEYSSQILKTKNFNSINYLLDRKKDFKLPVEDNYFDFILTFYSLEHFHPLEI